MQGLKQRKDCSLCDNVVLREDLKQDKTVRDWRKQGVARRFSGFQGLTSDETTLNKVREGDKEQPPRRFLMRAASMTATAGERQSQGRHQTESLKTRIDALPFAIR